MDAGRSPPARGRGLIGVCRVAAFNHTIQDQIGSATGQANFVAVERLAPIFYDDVGVRLEDRDDFLLGRDLLICSGLEGFFASSKMPFFYALKVAKIVDGH
jgi:hypothetical protein